MYDFYAPMTQQQSSQDASNITNTSCQQTILAMRCRSLLADLAKRSDFTLVPCHGEYLCSLTIHSDLQSWWGGPSFSDICVCFSYSYLCSLSAALSQPALRERSWVRVLHPVHVPAVRQENLKNSTHGAARDSSSTRSIGRSSR